MEGRVEEQQNGIEHSSDKISEEQDLNNINDNINEDTHEQILQSETVTENNEDTQNKKKKKSKNKKNKNKKGKKKPKEIPITDDDFDPLVDFTKKEGFVYDPEKAEFDINEVNLKKRPWIIRDVRSILYLQRLERKHNKLVHGLASVRDLTPEQIRKEEFREIKQYNEDIRDEIQREHIRNGDWEYVDTDIHFQPENEKELERILLEFEDPVVYFFLFLYI